jgi:hypothetical protein
MMIFGNKAGWFIAPLLAGSCFLPPAPGLQILPFSAAFAIFAPGKGGGS